MTRPTRDLLYVTIQLVLFVTFFLVPPVLRWHLPNWLHVLAMILAAMGILICALSILQLKSSLSPFPTPVEEGHLITSGMFKLVRHPIYSGLILFFIAFSIFSESFGRLLMAMLIVILFYFKSRYEERLLEKKYPEYYFYKQHTGRFIPYYHASIN